MQVVSLAQGWPSVRLVGLLEAIAVIPVRRMRVLPLKVPLRINRATVWGVVGRTYFV